MRNVLLAVFAVLFCANCGATATQTAPDTTPDATVAPESEPTCMFPVDAGVTAMRNRGWTRASCIVGVDLGQRLMALDCQDTSREGERNPTAEAVPPPGCTYHFDAIAAIVIASEWTLAVCFVEMDLVAGTMTAQCGNAPDDDSDAPAEPDPTNGSPPTPVMR